MSDDRNEMSSKTQHLEQIIIQVIFKCPRAQITLKQNRSLLSRSLIVLYGGWGERKRERAGYFNKESQREPLRRSDTKPQTKLKILMKMKRRLSE